ncbi:MAG: radical SAM protein [Desulfobacterales bacterium]|nr:radical SAM protein [Desulfobacterales bacterium]
MKIQSLSIHVPTYGCVNKCKFCVAEQHKFNFPNLITKSLPELRVLYKNDYIKRMEFARDNGCNTVMLTADGEVLMNENFLTAFGEMNKTLERPFRKIELQSSGYKLTDSILKWLRRDIGVNTISLSLNSFNLRYNWETQGGTLPEYVVIDKLCKQIKTLGFTLRLSLNISDQFENIEPPSILSTCKELGADQVTFRKLYSSGEGKEHIWMEKHAFNSFAFPPCSSSTIFSDILGLPPVTSYDLWFHSLDEYIQRNGRALQKLPFGAIKYDVDEMSVVVDTNCMDSGKISEDLKYMILRPNCKLYSHWDTKGSLIF